VLLVSPDGQPVAVHIRGPQSVIHVIPAIPAWLRPCPWPTPPTPWRAL